MEIYYDGNVYGIRWKVYDSNNQLVQQFEKIYSKKMTKQDVEIVKIEYYKLTDLQLSNIKFSVYTTYGEGELMGWVNYDKHIIDIFLDIH